MSEYQYYEFCKITSPLSQEARCEMAALSSRANIGTHGASYDYNYGDFRGDPKELLLKYFDVFFYISNFGIVELMFKYPMTEINFAELQNYTVEHVISCETYDQFAILSIKLSNVDGLGWVEGEGMLSDLLPLYDEIKSHDYRLLELVSVVDAKFNGSEYGIDRSIKDFKPLSAAQKKLLAAIVMND